jgi:hypothetical protein
MFCLAWLGVAAPAECAVGDPLLGSVVRSKEYVVRRAPRKQEEFIGEVRYRREDRKFSSDWALCDHDARQWRARGNVRAESRWEEGGTVLLEGQDAVHDERTGLGRLIGASSRDFVTLTRSGPLKTGMATLLGSDKARARRLEWDEPARTATLIGDVRLFGPHGDAEAEQALYRHDDRSLTLSGRRPYVAPREKEWSAAAQAETIRAASEPRTLRAEGAVKGWIHFEKDPMADVRRGRRLPGGRL